MTKNKFTFDALARPIIAALAVLALGMTALVIRIENQLTAVEKDNSKQVQSTKYWEKAYQTEYSDKKAAQDELAKKEGELKKKDEKLKTHESAAKKVEKETSRTTITQGSWTVGRDIDPGTYSTEQAVSDGCYWQISVSGTNGDNIIQNDIVSGGKPTVTLSEGQDFKSDRCGKWAKQ